MCSINSWCNQWRSVGFWSCGGACVFSLHLKGNKMLLNWQCTAMQNGFHIQLRWAEALPSSPVSVDCSYFHKTNSCKHMSNQMNFIKNLRWSQLFHNITWNSPSKETFISNLMHYKASFFLVNHMIHEMSFFFPRKYFHFQDGRQIKKHIVLNILYLSLRNISKLSNFIHYWQTLGSLWFILSDKNLYLCRYVNLLM